MPSLNIALLGPAPDIDDPPPGRDVLRALVSALEARGWKAESEPDNWRDAGWSINMAEDTQLVVSHVGNHTYWAQIWSTNSPGFFASLFKPNAHSETDAVISRCGQTLAHGLKSEAPVEIRAWKWDGPPSEGGPELEIRH